MQINSQIPLQSLAASAVGHLDAGRLDAAADAYRHILSITPGDAHSHYVLGLVYIEMKRLDDARTALEQAIVYDSRNSRFFRSLGDVLKMSNHVEGALSAYHQALRLAPDDADTLLNLGNALCTTGDHQQVLACYWRILVRTPNDSKARKDSPWYPTARLFRQTRPNDWSTVIEQVRVSLARLGIYPSAGSCNGHYIAGNQECDNFNAPLKREHI